MTIVEKNRLLKLKGSMFLNENIVVPTIVRPVDKDELIDTVYGTNPLTGLPYSDIDVMNRRDVSETVRSAVGRLQKRIPSNAPSSYDDDDLLDSVQQPNESNDDYIARLQSITENDGE